MAHSGSRRRKELIAQIDSQIIADSNDMIVIVLNVEVEVTSNYKVQVAC